MKFIKRIVTGLQSVTWLASQVYSNNERQHKNLGATQAREGEFRVPHQEQPNLDPYNPQTSEEEVRYPTIGQHKPAAHKVTSLLLLLLLLLH